MKAKTKLALTICFLTLFSLLAAAPFLAVAADDTTAAEDEKAAASGKKTVEYQTGFYYTIKKGDTLWDLSQKFSDTPWQWPELWKENNKIANPHRIYPGERIRLYRRRGAYSVGEGAGDAAGAGLGSGIYGGRKGSGTDRYGLAGMIDFEYAAIERVGFIRRKPAAARGTIFKVEGQKNMISTGDLVYIRPDDDADLKSGNIYTIYRTLQPIYDRQSKAFIGIQHYFSGALEITITRPEFVLGRIVAAYRPIRVGDRLMPFQEHLPRLTIQDSPEGLEGRIIHSEEHQAMFGESAIAFINIGKEAGVSPGQLYWVFKQEQFHINPKDKRAVTLTPVLLGELLVLRTEDTTSTVMVTDSRKAIHPGDRIIAFFKIQ